MKTIASNPATLGGRLREERQRLDLSQALLAGKVGISRISQANYESGKRSPDTVYLSAAFEAGVDVGYVITGKRSAAPDFYRMSAAFVLRSLEKRTGFAEDVLSFVIEAIADAAAAGWMADGLDMPTDDADGAEFDEWLPLADVSALISALNENARLLRDIFAVIHDTLAFNPSLRLAGGKRLAAVVMLYQAVRTAGESDRVGGQNAIRLAAP